MINHFGVTKILSDEVVSVCQLFFEREKTKLSIENDDAIIFARNT